MHVPLNGAVAVWILCSFHDDEGGGPGIDSDWRVGQRGQMVSEAQGQGGWTGVLRRVQRSDRNGAVCPVYDLELGLEGRVGRACFGDALCGSDSVGAIYKTAAGGYGFDDRGRGEVVDVGGRTRWRWE